MTQQTLHRYSGIIHDFDAFLNAFEKRFITVRRNPHKISGKDLESNLRQCFDEVSKVPWYKDAFRIESENPGKTLLHALGHYYVQEESAMIAPLALNPEKNSFVIDMCAAPGGKTTMLSGLMQNKGSITANDKSVQRIKSLVANVSRLGCINTCISLNDAKNIPAKQEFDFVLLDAPCTAEGNLHGIDLMPASMRESLSRLQKALLLKACDLAKPGGLIVYCTCTFAPEENERVVSKALLRKDISIKKINLKVPHEKGLESFEGEFFGSELKKAMRVYPHQMNSGGAFIARLVKKS